VIDLTCDRELGAVQSGDPLGNRETQTRSVDLAARRVGAVKAVEDVGQIVLGNPRTAVVHRYRCLIAVCAERHLDESGSRSVFERVVKQNP